MNGPRVEWDPRKNLSNLRKHGVSFEDAAEVFRDPLNVFEQDRIVDGEQRWQTIGVVDGVLLIVAHTLQEEGVMDEVVRIISARPATAIERRRYEAENG